MFKNRKTKQFGLASLVACACAALVPAVQGAVVIDAVEVGGDVVFTGQGTLNLAAWSFDRDGTDFSRIEPNDSNVVVGPSPAIAADIYVSPQGLTSPIRFGFGGQVNATSGSGDIFGISARVGPGSPFLTVPDGYVSGNSLSGTATYTGATFASLGMETGSYTWSWGSGGTADSVTLNVVPEPSSALLTGVGLAVSVLRRRRKC